jgi:hypothetical protein
MPAALLAGVVNRATTISPALNPPAELVSTRGAAVDGAPQAIFRTCVFVKPAHEMTPSVGGGLVPPPVPDCVTVAERVLPTLAGMASVQLLLATTTGADLPTGPASAVFMPQFADTLTLPPAAGRTPGLTEIVHVPVVVPGCEHETLMLPLPSGVAVNVALVQEIEPAIVGTGTANPADATAAASARLMVRFMYMVYLSGGNVPPVHRASPGPLRKGYLCDEALLYSAATRAATADKQFISSSFCGLR